MIFTINYKWNIDMHEQIKKDIGNLIKKRREELNMKQETILDYLDISPASLSNIEQGKANFTIEKFLDILNILGLELELKVKKV
jgi:transcriptional regulator with XRE-family HTH domain